MMLSSGFPLAVRIVARHFQGSLDVHRDRHAVVVYDFHGTEFPSSFKIAQNLFKGCIHFLALSFGLRRRAPRNNSRTRLFQSILGNPGIS
jgi:hypothetical protein